MGTAWDVFQPLLFGLIGAEIRISQLEAHTVGEAPPISSIEPALGSHLGSER